MRCMSYQARPHVRPSQAHEELSAANSRDRCAETRTSNADAKGTNAAAELGFNPGHFVPAKGKCVKMDQDGRGKKKIASSAKTLCMKLNYICEMS